MKAAVDAAIVAGAARYAQKELAALNWSINDVDTECRKQEGAAVRRYAVARALIEQTRMAAVDLQRLTLQRKQEALRDLDAERTRASEARRAALAALEAAGELRNRKGTKAVYFACEADLKELEKDFAKIDQTQQEGRPYEAIEYARALRAKYENVRTELETQRRSQD